MYSQPAMNDGNLNMEHVRRMLVSVGEFEKQFPEKKFDWNWVMTNSSLDKEGYTCEDLHTMERHMITKYKVNSLKEFDESKEKFRWFSGRQEKLNEGMNKREDSRRMEEPGKRGEVRRMFATLEDLRKQFPENPNLDWRLVMIRSGLNEKGYTAESLLALYQLMQDKYKVTTLGEFEAKFGVFSPPPPKQDEGANKKSVPFNLRSDYIWGPAGCVNWAKLAKDIRDWGDFSKMRAFQWDEVIEQMEMKDYEGRWEQLCKDFYSYAVPKFGEFGIKQRVNLQPWIRGNSFHANSYAMMAIFHSMDEATPTRIKEVISKMLSDKLLAEVVGVGDSAEFWYRMFVFRLCEGNYYDWNERAWIVKEFRESFIEHGGVLEMLKA